MIEIHHNTIHEVECASDGSPIRSEDLADLMPGDVWVVRDDHTAQRLQRMVLVLDTNPGAGWLHVALVSNESEWASDNDLILEPALSRIPYDVMVETGALSKIWWHQAVRRVGLIDGELLDAVLAFIWGERTAQLEDRRGLLNPTDATSGRNQFELEELGALQTLGSTSDERFGVPVKPKVLIDTGVVTADALERRDVPAVCDAIVSDGFEIVKFRSISGERGALQDPVSLPYDARLVLLAAAQRGMLQGTHATALCVGTAEAHQSLAVVAFENGHVSSGPSYVYVGCGQDWTVGCIDGAVVTRSEDVNYVG